VHGDRLLQKVIEHSETAIAFSIFLCS